MARSLGWPLVVKPVDDERGEGVTVGLSEERQLLKAFSHALDTSKTKSVVVEREASGVCHRLFIANQRLLSAVKRLPKSVQGDGRQTIEALVKQANRAEDCKPPWLRSEPFLLDALAAEAITRAGFVVDTIPAKGAWCP